MNRRDFLRLAATLTAGGMLVPGELFRGRSQIAIPGVPGFASFEHTIVFDESWAHPARMRWNIEEAMRIMGGDSPPGGRWTLIAGKHIWKGKLESLNIDAFAGARVMVSGVEVVR